MQERFLSIWFRYLKTDWVSNRRPALKDVPFVLSASDHGRMVVAAANPIAQQRGIHEGMVVADARAVCPGIDVLDDISGINIRLLRSLAFWCIRFTPVVGLDLPDGLILDISGCAHLWGGEEKYVNDIRGRLNERGYSIRTGIADTIGMAWALAHFSHSGNNFENLPPAALRLDAGIIERLEKLGLKSIGGFINMPRYALRRRFGAQMLQRLDQATGKEKEIIQPVVPVNPFSERLPCCEPIVTLTGIQVALENLLELLCQRLVKEGKGLREAQLNCYRVDNEMQQVKIGTHRPSQNPKHLFKLFQEKIQTIDPGLGIELFTLDSPKTEDVSALQEKLWENEYGLESAAIAELIDRIANKTGQKTIRRYLPDEHYWPERSVKSAESLTEKHVSEWVTDKPRPLHLLPVPVHVKVTAPVPDYPPMLFRYKGQVYNIKKADGPERIEQEWWLQEGEHRDYYVVEDESGARYWIFRLGHYDPGQNNQWFLHGYFA